VKYLGRFSNAFDAALKYDEAARSMNLTFVNFSKKMDTATESMLRKSFLENNQTVGPFLYAYLHPSILKRVHQRG